MPIKFPLDLNGQQIIVGWRGKSSSLEYGPNNVPFTTEYPIIVPISGTEDGALYVALTGSASSASVGIYGSSSAGWVPIGAALSEDGSGLYALKTDTELILSGNIVISNVKTLATDPTNSGTLGYGRIQSSSNYQYVIDPWSLMTSMYRYQLGVDGGSYDNAAGGTTVYVYGTTNITGSTLCPFVYNTSDRIMHDVDLQTATTSSFTVSPAITSATASLIIRYNAPELPYNQLAGAYDVNILNPQYGHYSISTLISESNGALGLTTSSDFPVINYNYFNIQFSRLLNVTASISATLNSDASPPSDDWKDITYDLYGAYLITGSCILERDTPVKYAQLRVNYYKSNASNGILVKYSLF